mmetsp:Transcript_21228/g.35035  ORF Transcript_21228/g.35035 Transcript_21228/m.35035 type:complete len:90 (+) Transcript_21228:29-298(+)
MTCTFARLNIRDATESKLSDDRVVFCFSQDLVFYALWRHLHDTIVESRECLVKSWCNVPFDFSFAFHTIASMLRIKRKRVRFARVLGMT